MNITHHISTVLRHKKKISKGIRWKVVTSYAYRRTDGHALMTAKGAHKAALITKALPLFVANKINLDANEIYMLMRISYNKTN